MDPDIQPALIERLDTYCPAFESVSDAWFMAPLDNLDAELPMAAVYLHQDGPDGDPDTLRGRQRLTLVYGVWIVCARDEFRDHRHAVREALHGWVPTEHHEPLAYAGGQTSDIRGAHVWWLERWSVDTWLFYP
tara:strand:- start:83 stop:481 length:399 start_codon:yes stop_codon:yes gene_type:complete